MSDIKVNSANGNCPSFYKEKIKENHKDSKLCSLFKKFLETLKKHK